MAANIRQVEYFYTTVEDKPGQAYDLLAKLASVEINLLAFSAVPMGPRHTQLTIFPELAEDLERAAGKFELSLTGPQHAFLIQGDDQLGSLTSIHRKLFDADINVYASTGVTDGSGRYGYLIYVKDEDFPAAAEVLTGA
jgi:hypothetical protein